MEGLFDGEVRFYKMDGAGNDFVALDGRGRPCPSDEVLAAVVPALCDRYHGVGADGVIIILDSPTGVGADFAMKYINADGSVGEMCGNGARCACVFAEFLAIGGPSKSFHTDAGLYRGDLVAGGACIHFPSVGALPVERVLQGPARPIDRALFLRVGVPHAVLFVEELDMVDVAADGRAIRHDPAFQPAGTNANFAQFRNGALYVRTYERGVEAETKACGTGSVATACCWAWSQKQGGPQSITVVPTGGIALEIGFDATETGFDRVTLAGPARIVFEGKMMRQAR